MKRIPPYLPFTTFRGFLDGLSVSGVPTRVDRSVMASKSGSTQALLLAAIRYFGLVSDNGLPSRDLDALVKAKGKERQEVWRRVLEKSYPNLFKLDLQRATTQQISEAFRREGLSADETIRKALNFFSLAVKDAGLKLSPHIKPYAGRKSGRPPKAAVQIQDLPQTPRFLTESLLQNGSKSDLDALLSRLPSFDHSWSAELKQEWFKWVENLYMVYKRNNKGTD